MSIQPGMDIGPYHIEDQLGQGGMATVYKAHHQRLDRYVAVKFLHHSFLQDENFRNRFNREARIVARLDHPNIVPIYDYNEHENTPYLVMKYVDGPTLKQRAFKQGLTPDQVIEILAPIADALDYAHSQGVLHRDMKPSNLLIDRDGRPYITDFGLARMVQTGESTISHDMMLGTPFYISPEQAQGERELDSRTDLYSLGIILYELITGKVPFTGDTPYAIVHGHIYRSPEPPTVHNPSLPAAVDAVMARALAKRPEDRFNTAAEMIAAFRAALTETQSVAAPAITKKTTPQETISLSAEPARATGSTPSAADAHIERDAKDRPVQVERSFDLGSIAWGDIGRRVEEGIRSAAEFIEETVDSELSARRGVSLTPEEEARRKVAKRLKEREGLVGHLSAYIGVNLLLWAIWFFTGMGFPWPMFVTFGWGIGMFAHGMEYYNKFGPGAAKREAAFEREVERELQRSQMLTVSDKLKNEDKRKNEDALSLDELAEDEIIVRLSDEGELTDSFIEEREEQRRSARR